MQKLLFRLFVADTRGMHLSKVGEYLNLLNAFYDAFRADMYHHGEGNPPDPTLQNPTEHPL